MQADRAEQLPAGESKTQCPACAARHPSDGALVSIGDNDQELMMAQLVENQFNRFGLPHEWHLYSGAHTEEYWKAHVEEYIRWYAEDWNKELSQ